MAFIFIDESGDLGFKKSSSRWFVFAVALVDEGRVLDVAVKKVWKSLKMEYKSLGELHAYRSNDSTRAKMFKSISDVSGLKIACLVLDKRRVPMKQRQNDALYNHLSFLLMDRLLDKAVFTDQEILEIHIDRKDTKKSLQKSFVSLLSTSISKKAKNRFKIALRASHDDKSLQAADFISWAIFRKYERKDNRFYDIIKTKIIDEHFLYP